MRPVVTDPGLAAGGQGAVTVDAAAPTALAEFRSGWPVLLAAILGAAVGLIAIPGPAVGVFMHDLQAEFGWSRAQISLGPTIMAGTLALVAPWLGWLADRVPPRAILATSLAALSLSLFLFSRLDGDLRSYYAGFAAMAAAGSGAASLVYARLLSGAFRRARGLALGLAMIGNGAAGVVLPLLLVPYAAAHGWRQGFIALAVLVAAAAPLVLLLIGARRGEAAKASGDAPGQTFPEARRTRVFWLMAAAFALVPLAVTGLQLHLLAYLADTGMDPGSAALIASAAGGSLIVARVLTGFLIDHLFAPLVGAVMMGLSALAIGLLAALGAPVALLGAVAIGLALGSEIDLIAYLISRYFGLRAYGQIYGTFYALVLFGSAASGVIYGLTVDLTGSYDLVLFAACGILVVCAAAFAAMPAYPAAEAAAAGDARSGSAFKVRALP